MLLPMEETSSTLIVPYNDLEANVKLLAENVTGLVCPFNVAAFTGPEDTAFPEPSTRSLVNHPFLVAARVTPLKYWWHDMAAL